MKIGGKEFQTQGKTYICGILNVTPDSFSDGGRFNRMDQALYHVEEMIGDGMDLLDICFRASFMPDYEQAIALLQDIAAEISRASDGAVSPDAPRVLLTGVPTGLGSHKVIQLLEECGASIVCIDNCTCYKKVRLMMDETADPLTELAGRYLDTPCSVMSPNPNRYTALRELTEAFQADAVVDLTWQGCQTYDVESWSVKKFVREELDLPFLQIVTDYSEADTEQLKVRIEAFLEMLN